MKAAAISLPVLITLFLSMTVTRIASAQEYRGRVQGVVTDSSDAAVAGAVIRLRNVGTGVATVRQSDSYGHYLFDLVLPGTYALLAEMQGFSRFEQENILVQNRGDVTVNVKMQLGAVAETVKVTEAPRGRPVQHERHGHHGGKPAGE